MKYNICLLIVFLVAFLAGFFVCAYFMLSDMRKHRELSEKHLAILQLYDTWMKNVQEKKSIVNYLKEQGYTEIALYGMGYVGKRLLAELANAEIHVRYVIDKTVVNVRSVRVISPNDEFEDVDAIIVTSNFYFDSIKYVLEKKTDIPILNLEKILQEMAGE